MPPLSRRSKSSLVRTTVAWVNEVREQIELPPIKRLSKGHRRHPNYCPVALSIVRGTQYKANVEPLRFSVWSAEGLSPGVRLLASGVPPHQVTRFVVLFDQGEPSLDYLQEK
jgi:hypothetical protein